MAQFVFGIVVGLILAILVALALPSLWRRRGDGPLDEEVETRILLGLRPEPEEADPGGPAVAHPRDYDSAALQELSTLDADSIASEPGA